MCRVTRLNSNRQISAFVLVCGFSLEVISCFPMMVPASLFVVPQQNFMPQNYPVPLTSPFRMSYNSFKLFKHAQNHATPKIQQQTSPEVPVTTRQPQHELNGHQNPQLSDGSQDNNIVPTPNEHFQDINNDGTNQNYQGTIIGPDDEDTIITESAASQGFSDAIPVMSQFPDERFSIGQIIMAVPWLPVEVNVPDTIAWMYNGISTIIGGIGQRIPLFNRNPNEPRPYSPLKEMNSLGPMFVPLIHMPMPIINVQPQLVGVY